MDLGMPTLIGLNSTEECAALCRGLGLDFLELNMNLPEYQTDKLDIERLIKTAEKYGIYYTVHLDENLAPCDFNGRIARAYTDTVLDTIITARRLSVPVLNMHLSEGVYFSLPDRREYLFDRYIETYISKLTEFRDRCESAIGGTGIKICVENSGGYDKNFLQEGIKLLLGSEAFALTFDIGHNAAIGGGDEKIILEHQDRLCHMHMHDAKAKRNHLPLGEGELDLRGYLHLAESSGCRVVIETKTPEAMKKSVNWLKNNYAAE